MRRATRAGLWLGLAVTVGAVLAGCGAAGNAGDTAARADRPVTSAAAPRDVEVAAPPTLTIPSSTPSPARPASPCRSNRWAQWVYVDLGRQHLWMCEGQREVRDTAVTTGMRGPDTETPTGRYRIQGLNRNSVLTLANGATYPVKYWIPFDAPLFGFHDSSWQRFPYGSPRYRTAGSHGCVHMPLAAIRFLYRWAEIGTRVTIRR